MAAAALDVALAEIPALAPHVGQIGLLPALLAPADAPTVDLPPTQEEEYVGHYADPGQAITLTSTDDGLEVSVETIEQPGAFLPSIFPSPSPVAPVAFLDTDMAVAGGGRLPFVRDEDGRVAWISAGLRLLPRENEGP